MGSHLRVCLCSMMAFGDSLWRPGTGGLWFQSNKRNSWGWEAAELCLGTGEDGKNRSGSLNTEGLCWSCLQAEDACPLSPRRMQWLRSSSPDPAASAGVIPAACTLCCAVQENSTETEKKLPHALWFQLIKKSKAGSGVILLFVSSLLPLAISFSNCNLKSPFGCKIDLRINVSKTGLVFFPLR